MSETIKVKLGTVFNSLSRIELIRLIQQQESIIDQQAAEIERLKQQLAVKDEMLSQKQNEIDSINFWRGIVLTESGKLDVEQVSKELHDYYVILDNVSKVYSHVTGGRIGKANTDASYVIAEADDIVSSAIQGALEDAKKDGEE